jgi:serine/threonine protein kinase
VQHQRAAQRQAAAAQTVNGSASNANSAQPLSQELAEGTLLKGGHYHIGPVLGRGSFGTTFRAVDKRLARLVAIKEFFPEGSVRQGATILPPASLGRAGFEQERAAFAREALLLARFHRPGIVAVYDAFEENDTAYMVMEWIKGKTLSQLLKERGGPLPAANAVRYILSVADALSAVHEEHLLHRDVKPGNIIVNERDEAVLIDFGAARSFDRYQRTTAMTAIGTPGYAPLEQWGSSGRFGPPSDVYALAATLYHLLTGVMPPSAADRAAGDTLVAPRTLNPAVPPWVDVAVCAALAVQMDARPQTMALFAHALRAGLPAGTQVAYTAAAPAATPPATLSPATAAQPAAARSRRSAAANAQQSPAAAPQRPVVPQAHAAAPAAARPPAAQQTPPRPLPASLPAHGSPSASTNAARPAPAAPQSLASARGSASDQGTPQQIETALPPAPAPFAPLPALPQRTGLLSADTGRTVLKNAMLVPLAPPVFAGSMILLALGTPVLAVSSIVLPPDGRRRARRALRRSARTGVKGVALSARWFGAFVATATVVGVAASAAPLLLFAAMFGAFNAGGGRHARHRRRYARRAP